MIVKKFEMTIKTKFNCYDQFLDEKHFALSIDILDNTFFAKGMILGSFNGPVFKWILGLNLSLITQNNTPCPRRLMINSSCICVLFMDQLAALLLSLFNRFSSDILG